MLLIAAGKFFWFLLFNLLTLIYFTFFGESGLSCFSMLANINKLTSHMLRLHQQSVFCVCFLCMLCVAPLLVAELCVHFAWLADDGTVVLQA